jgi:hypothetical protein
MVLLGDTITLEEDRLTMAREGKVDGRKRLNVAFYSPPQALETFL